MHRRQFLQASLSVGLGVTAGCSNGVNKELDVINNSGENVTLHIIIDRNKPAGSQNKKTIFDEDVTVSAKQTKTLTVLGKNQFELTVTRTEQEMTFWTRPICSAARTAIIIEESGELRNEVEDCE
ncbi:hypothetical protein [Halomicrococcus sp. SG-WS-1]|uniref:hypothetical protein n=1 Tax=Halomicrococcus sp. SG-WS-1 TaxID=3439057 RepID=UPI003F7A6DC9